MLMGAASNMEMQARVSTVTPSKYLMLYFAKIVSKSTGMRTAFR
jgi:hypothetical protein